jgi:hypothetical protein
MNKRRIFTLGILLLAFFFSGCAGAEKKEDVSSEKKPEPIFVKVKIVNVFRFPLHAGIKWDNYLGDHFDRHYDPFALERKYYYNSVPLAFDYFSREFGHQENSSNAEIRSFGISFEHYDVISSDCASNGIEVTSFGIYGESMHAVLSSQNPGEGGWYYGGAGKLYYADKTIFGHHKWHGGLDAGIKLLYAAPDSSFSWDIGLMLILPIGNFSASNKGVDAFGINIETGFGISF